MLEEVKRRNLAKDADYNGAWGFTKMLKDQVKGRIDSWAISWYFSAFIRGMLTLYPGKSYVKNIGFDFDATHTKYKMKMFDVELNQSFNKLEKIEVVENIEARKKLRNFLGCHRQTFFQRVIRKLKKITQLANFFAKIEKNFL